MAWWNDDKDKDGLTGREQTVLAGIVKGERISAIAKRLCLGPSTISGDRAHILAKLKCGSNADLIRWQMARERAVAQERVARVLSKPDTATERAA